MIDRSSRSLRIRVTGRVPTAKGMDYRSLIGAVKRDGFLDFLYFTDYETSDAVWYALSTSGRPTGGPQGDVISEELEEVEGLEHRAVDRDRP